MIFALIWLLFLLKFNRCQTLALCVFLENTIAKLSIYKTTTFYVMFQWVFIIKGKRHLVFNRNTEN